MKARHHLNLHGQVVRAVVDGRGNIIGFGHIIERSFFTVRNFYSDSRLKKTA